MKLELFTNKYSHFNEAGHHINGWDTNKKQINDPLIVCKDVTKVKIILARIQKWLCTGETRCESRNTGYEMDRIVFSNRKSLFGYRNSDSIAEKFNFIAENIVHRRQVCL